MDNVFFSKLKSTMYNKESRLLFIDLQSSYDNITIEKLYECLQSTNINQIEIEQKGEWKITANRVQNEEVKRMNIEELIIKI